MMRGHSRFSGESGLLQCNIGGCGAGVWHHVCPVPPSRWRGGRWMETTMNTQLVNPAVLIAALADPQGDVGLWQKLRARVGEEVRYHLALRELRRLDDRDLDDLNLGRGDLPGLARAHARATATVH